MAYSVSGGKIATSHPLMDSIIYYSKIILDGMVLKNAELANNYETESSMENSDYFIAVKNGSMRLGFFPSRLLFYYLQEDDIGYSEYEANKYVKDINKIPREKVNDILELCNKKFLRDYEEENFYYRQLNGLPPYGTHNYDIYLTEEEYGDYLKRDISGRSILDIITDSDFDNKPLHEFTVTEINTIESLGILDVILDKYITNNENSEDRNSYKYLRYLGGRKIDIYQARIAKNWDILYMPPVDIYVSSRFRELYEVNRDIYDRKINQLAYSVRSDYFEEMLMFMIVCQTFNDMVVDTPEWYIRRDVIDLRSVQYFLESQGVKFFADIPMRYQIRIVKSLNKLIRYKSTDKNIFDILEIFASEDTEVYQYYLLKQYKTTDLRQYTINGYPPSPYTWSIDDINCGNENVPPGPDELCDGGSLDPVVIFTYDCGDIDNFNDKRIDEIYEGRFEDIITEEPTDIDYTTLDFIDEDEIIPDQEQESDRELLDFYDIEEQQEDPEIPDDLYDYGCEETDILDSWEGDLDDFESESSGEIEVLDFQDFDDPNYVVDNTVLYIYNFGSEETPDVMAWEVLPKDHEGNYIFDCWYEDYELYHEGDLDHTNYVNQTGDGRGNDVEGLDIIGDEMITYDFGDEDLSLELDEVSQFDIYIYEFESEDAYIIPDYDVTEKEIEYKQSQMVIKDSNGNIYDLEFVKVPIGDQYDNYIKDPKYREDYDDITLDDKYWDGEDSHSYIKNLHLQSSYYDEGVFKEHNYTIENTKFMGLEYNVSLSDYIYQQCYYLGMMFNTKIDIDDISIGVPSIKQNTFFNIRNLFLFLYCCNGLYTGDDIDVNNPSEAVMDRTDDKPEFEPYYEIDGGYPWTGGGEPEEGEIINWSVPSIDFGSFDIEYEKIIELIECGEEELFSTFESEFDGTILDYGSEEYFIIPVNMEYETIDGDYDFGYDDITEFNPINAEVFDFYTDIIYNNEKEYDTVWEFGDLNGDPLYEDSDEYTFDIDTYHINIPEKPLTIPGYYLETGIDECGDEDHLENPYEVPLQTDYLNEDDFIKTYGRECDMGEVIDNEEDIIDETWEFDESDEATESDSGVWSILFDFGSINEQGIEEYTYNELELIEYADAELADEGEDLVCNGPNEDAIVVEALTDVIDYGSEDDGKVIKFVGEEYECGDEETIPGVWDTSDTFIVDFNDITYDHYNMTDEESDLFYNGVVCGDEDNTEDEPVAGYIITDVVVPTTGYDREDTDVMNEVYDFGYQYDIDLYEYLYDYDYDEITLTSIDSDEVLFAEMTEPDPYFHNMDFGFEDKDSIISSEWTVDYDMGTYDSDNSVVTNKTNWDMGEILENTFDNNPNKETIDFDIITETSFDDPTFNDIYDFGYYVESYEDYRTSITPDTAFAAPNRNAFNNEVLFAAVDEDDTEDTDKYWYGVEIWDCGEITEESIDDIDPDKDVYIGTTTFNFYTDEPQFHILKITKDNWTTIIGQYYINQENGDLYIITEERASTYIGTVISYLDRWWNIDNYGYYTEDYDGHTPGELTISVSIKNYQLVIGQQYVDHTTGKQIYIDEDKALSFTYSDVEFVITEDNHECFIGSEFLDEFGNYIKLNKINYEKNINDRIKKFGSRIIIKTNADNYKNYIGQKYIDPESKDEFDFTAEYGLECSHTNVAILDWYWNTTNRDFVNIWFMDINGGQLPYNIVTKSTYYDYIRSDHTLMFKNFMGRLYGFNMDIELEQLEDDIGFNHSKFGFERSYTLADMGCDTYIVQKKFSSIKELYNVYLNNTKCYNNLKYLLENAETRDEKMVYSYVFYTLFTRPYDMEFYIINNGDVANTYDQLLKKFDYTLYTKYLELKDEFESTKIIYNIRDIMNDIVDSLSYYMNSDTLKYALSFVYTHSFDGILTYIQEMIDFFKSWKVQFVNHKINYSVDDKANNTAITGDQIGEIKYNYYGTANSFMMDSLFINTLYFIEDGADDNISNFEASVIDVAVHYTEDDIFKDRDYNGYNPSMESIIDEDDIEDIDGGGFEYVQLEDGSVVLESEIDNNCYYQYDAGRVDHRMYLDTLDGGGASDNSLGNDYCDIDGGSFADEYIGIDGSNYKPYDIEDFYGYYSNGYYNIEDPETHTIIKKVYHKEKSYNVDAGVPNIHTVYTDTAITNISEYNEVSVDVRISGKYGNGLQIVESDSSEPPIWPMRNIDFGDENSDTVELIYDYGDIDNPLDVLEKNTQDAYGNEDDPNNTAENSATDILDFENYNDSDIIYMDNKTYISYYTYEDACMSVFGVKFVDTKTFNSRFTYISGIEVDTRTSKYFKLYDFGNEEYATDANNSEEELMIFDYGEITAFSTLDDFITPDANDTGTDVGLYFDYTKYASNNRLDTIGNRIKAFGDPYVQQLKFMRDTMIAMQSYEALSLYINSTIYNILKLPLELYNQFGGSYDNLINIKSAEVSNIYNEEIVSNWYDNIEPFAWRDFDGNIIKEDTNNTIVVDDSNENNEFILIDEDNPDIDEEDYTDEDYKEISTESVDASERVQGTPIDDFTYDIPIQLTTVDDWDCGYEYTYYMYSNSILEDFSEITETSIDTTERTDGVVIEDFVYEYA